MKPVLALGLAALAAASPGPRAPAPASGHALDAVPDTILWRDLTRARPVRAVGRDPDAAGAVQLGLQERPLPLLLSPSGFLGPAVSRFERLLSREAFVAAAIRYRLGRPFGDVSERPFLPSPAEPAPRATVPAGARTFASDFADLSMRIEGQAELGGNWSRFEPCLDRLQEACNPGVFPRLSPDMLFAVRVGGTIADRIDVDVDFDQIREFEAANTISIVYRGDENEIIRSLEVGDVTFNLPQSRFLTEGIPAGNFGFQATGQLGPVDFDAVWAEQRGDLSSRVFRLTGVGSERGFVQEDTIVLDDADYADGQFFFLFDPTRILDFPHIDALALNGSEASPRLAPGAQPIRLYRFDNEPVVRQQVEGFIQADAVAELDGDRVVESGWFRYLQPGLDYFVHASGLWIGLRNPLRADEMLAVSYVSAAGDTIGDVDPERTYNLGLRPELRLLKASQANHQPGRPTWDLEMKQFYRVSASPDVERSSLSLTISLGEPSAGRTFKRDVTGEDITFLRLLGLDQEAPADRIDPAFVYEPGGEIFDDDPAVRGTFVVFPTLRPFAEPPPLDRLGLSADETREILGDDANEAIYEDPDPFERDNGGRFRLTIPFRLRTEGLISSFSLGALGIREGSERIVLGERVLQRGVDYDIDYDIGQVTLRNPEALFAVEPDASVRATWEQKQIFQTAPTSVFGFNAHTGLGPRGRLDFTGLYQTERTLVTRPTLGVEPAAVTLAGVSGAVENPLPWLDRALDGVPGLRSAGGSELSVEGEVALSLPTPNTIGDVFVDDFDAPAERLLSLVAREWFRGSAPESSQGAEGVLPPSPGPDDLASVVWQHTWIVEGTQGDSLGIHEGFFPRQEIDGQIRFAGSETREPGLLVSFGEGAAFAERRWASITTTLSPAGSDLTKSEFLEFYVAGGEALTLVLDLGAVSEDAMFVDRTGATTGFKENGVPWGLDILDYEADPALGEIWGNEADARGVWGETCLAERGRIYRIGDERAVCTRGNGRRDSEDFDGDGNLDRFERHLRWVLELDGSSEFLVRRKDETGTEFALYRIPLQGMTGAQVGGPITDADLRAVKNIRLTLTGDRPDRATFARMRIIGSRWIRRNQEGVLRGIVGDTVAVVGEMEVTPVSRVTEGAAYQSPPGVLEQLADPSEAFGGQGIEFNEKSLAVRFSNLQPADRAEVYNRFPQRPRNFLTYREARVWAVARSGDFGLGDPHEFFVKVGSDPENFYLFRSRLAEPPALGVTPGDWRELVIDFDEWFDLRRQAEELLAAGLRQPGDPPLELWSADSTYLIVMEDRGSAPDLANVREVSMGVWNRGEAPIGGEVWINELRLGRGVTDAGLAGHLDVALTASDVLDARLTFSNRGSFFRQLRESPTYQTDRALSFRTTLNLDRLAPVEWGVALPLTVSHDRITRDPTFLANSDVLAERLPDLRDIGSRRTRVSVGFRKRTPSAEPVVSALLDGVEANVGWFTSRTGAITSSVEAEGIDARAGYSRRMDHRDFALVPDALAPVVRALLPGFLEDRLLDARVRWTPERVAMNASYLRHDSEAFRFDRVIPIPADTALRPTRSPRELLETSAEISLRPFESLTADLTLLSTRDLLPSAEQVGDPRVQRRLDDERARFLGVDWGWETLRTLRTRVGFRPRLFSWLTSDLGWTSGYGSDRNASFVERIPVPGDTTVLLLRNASGDRNIRAFFQIDPEGLARDLFGEPTDPAREGWAPLPQLLEALRPIGLTWSDGLSSRFNRDAVGPGLGYQLGLGSPEAFRFIDADTAATFTDRSTLSATTGVELPGFELDVAWRTSDATTLDVRSDRTIDDRTWPDVNARLLALPMPWLLGRVAERVTASAGVVRRETEIDFGGGGRQRRVVEDVQVPVSVSLDWVGPTRTIYRGSFRDGEGSDPTGDTDRDRQSHSFTLTSALSPPGGLAERLSRPVDVALTASYIAERECRAVAQGSDCVAFIDQIDRSFSLTLGAALEGFQLGLLASLTDRQSFVGQRNGSTLFQLSLSGSFVIETGLSSLGRL